MKKRKGAICMRGKKKETTIIDANSVGRYIIRCNESTSPKEKLTSIKLQNLLYYCFGTYKATTGEDLFSDSLIPYRYGCKIEKVYDTYRIYGYSEIENKEWYLIDLLTEEEKQSIRSVWDQLGHLSDHVLIEMVRNETPFNSNPMNKEDIGNYFAQNYQKNL